MAQVLAECNGDSSSMSDTLTVFSPIFTASATPED